MKKWLVIIILAFGIAAAYTAGRQLGHQFSAVVMGVLVGIGVSLPLNLLSVILTRRAAVGGNSSPASPMIVYTPPVMAMDQQLGTEGSSWEAAQQWIQPVHREFRALGGEEIVDDLA